MGEFEIKIYNFSSGGFCKQFGNKIIYVANMMPTENKKQIKFSDLQISSLIHEFSHPYCNPLGIKYFQNKAMTFFFEESKEHGLESCYNNPIIAINEYVVRAIQIYLTSNYVDAKRIVENQKRKGYNHIEELIKLLKHKNNYENFESFYENEIVPFFHRLNDKKISNSI